MLMRFAHKPRACSGSRPRRTPFRVIACGNVFADGWRSSRHCDFLLNFLKLGVHAGLVSQKWWLGRHTPKALRDASSGQSARIGKNFASKREGELQIEPAIRSGIAVRPP